MEGTAREVDSQKLLIFEEETMTPFSEEKRKLGRSANGLGFSIHNGQHEAAPQLICKAELVTGRTPSDPILSIHRVRKEILSDIQLLVASGPDSNPILIPCFLCH